MYIHIPALAAQHASAAPQLGFIKGIILRARVPLLASDAPGLAVRPFSHLRLSPLRLRGLDHTCHILPSSEIDLGLFLQAEGNIYFTELAGNYDKAFKQINSYRHSHY